MVAIGKTSIFITYYLSVKCYTRDKFKNNDREYQTDALKIIEVYLKTEFATAISLQFLSPWCSYAALWYIFRFLPLSYPHSVSLLSLLWFLFSICLDLLILYYGFLPV